MTTRRDIDEVASPEFDRRMAAWFDAEAHVREPEYLLARTLSRTAHARRRSAWLLPERWLPMQLTMRRVVVPRAVGYAALIAALVLALAIAVLIVGSQRRLPPPFGVAANGSILLASDDGDIVALDPDTGTTSVVVGGPDVDSDPTPSLDGTRVSFVRSAGGTFSVHAVDVRGGAAVTLASDIVAVPHRFAWSPDGRRLAWLSGPDLWMAATDASGAHVVDVNMPVSSVAWRPPTGAEVVIRAGTEGRAALYRMNADGSNLRAITAADGTEFEYLEADFSPDGARLAYSNVPENRVHVLAIDAGTEVVIEPRPGAKGTLFPKWSPDGTKLAVLHWQTDGEAYVGVVPATDLSAPIVITGPSFELGPDFDWSPDGTTILAAAWESDQPWLLDPAGGPGRKPSWKLSGPLSTEGGENVMVDIWQRTAK